MTIEITLKLSSLLISITVFLQCLELLLLRPYWSKNGIWDWDTLKQEHSSFFARIFSPVMKEAGYFAILILGVLSALLGMFTSNYLALPLMLAVCLFTAKRFRGTFNGGSDYMTILVLIVCSVAYLFREYAQIAFGYLAVQLILSYFLAGLTKLKNSEWRSGLALQRLLTSTSYNIPATVTPLVQNHGLLKTMSWMVIIFELMSPSVFLSLYFCIAYIAIALAFHLVNFYLLGLNRFVFAWASAYPSLYWFFHFLYTSPT